MTTYIFILIIALFLFAINRYILVNFREKINNLNIIDKNFSKPNPNPKHGGRLNVTGVAGHTGAERHRCAGF